MNYLFGFVLLLHGLIHLLGFVQAFGLAKIGTLSGRTLVPLSAAMDRVAGVAWLVAGMLFLATLLGFLTQKTGWWWWGIAGIGLSQVLIVLYWPDARAGTGVNVVLALVIGLALAHEAFGTQSRREADALRAEVGRPTPIRITRAMIDSLPAPVRQYLTDAGVVGQPIPHVVRLKQTGTFLVRAGGPRLDFEAEQTFTVQPVGFVWLATMRQAGVPLFRARDSYRRGRGRMFVRAGSVLTVTDQTGPELDEGALLRFLSELVWFPTAFLSPNVTFEPIDARSALVSLTDHGRRVSATMQFDERGEFRGMLALRRRAHDGTYSLDTWHTPARAYGYRAGLRIPTQGKAVWKLREGDLDYIDLTIGEVVCEPPTTSQPRPSTATPR